MEYTNNEKQILSLMERTDFKNISKIDLLSYASKIGELRPEVAKEILANYPEFVSLIKNTLSEYKGMIDAIIESDDKSINEYYKIANKEMDSAINSRIQFYSLLKQIQDDYSKCLDNPNLQPEMIMEILNRQVELVKMANEKDTEIRNQ